MPTSPPAARRSVQFSSPDQERLSPFLSENRNTELYHLEALAAAQAEHERVREGAIRAYQVHEHQEQSRRLREQQEKIRAEQRIEEERIKNEERLRAEELRLRALRAKAVPELPPEEKPAAPAPTTSKQPAPSTAASTATQQPEAQAQPQAQVNGVNSAKPVQLPPIQSLQQSSPAANPFLSKPSGPTNPFGKPAPQQNGLFASNPPQATAAATTTPASAPAPQPSGAPVTDRYVQIHKNLKKLRASMLEQTKYSEALKQRLGNMRRELRKNLGQLIAAIQTVLNESLTQVPSALVDPSDFVTDKREPVEGAVRNEAHLPSLFIYLLNQFSKGIINQFIQECGGQPKTADPIGVIAALIFSNKGYHWRGKTLIDILMAKLRVACPVLFGYRGNEKTEQGRARLGWKREGAGWISEQMHVNQMKGLAVGYASIALRDFSKSANTNPWPPSRYWASMARIVNTPPAEISNTQCVVLRSMIEHYEERFMTFYGTAAIAALRKALVEFPAKAPEKSPGAFALLGLAEVLKLNVGIEL